VLHPWRKTTLAAILATLPAPPPQSAAERRAAWERWQEGLTVRFTLPDRLPPVRLLLVLDNLSGHKTPSLVLWLVDHGSMPLYTPLSGSWLTMAESIQRILVRRALTGQTPASPDDIIQWLESTACGWNADPTPFVWAGKRQPGASGAGNATMPSAGPGPARTVHVIIDLPPRSMASFMPTDPLVGHAANR